MRLRLRIRIPYTRLTLIDIGYRDALANFPVVGEGSTQAAIKRALENVGAGSEAKSTDIHVNSEHAEHETEIRKAAENNRNWWDR